jgi:hypothetical protein
MPISENPSPLDELARSEMNWKHRSRSPLRMSGRKMTMRTRTAPIAALTMSSSPLRRSPCFTYT